MVEASDGSAGIDVIRANTGAINLSFLISHCRDYQVDRSLRRSGVCQWLQKLHTFGLLNNSFRPTAETRILQTYLRQRETCLGAASKCVQHMQKTLAQMNVQPANVISDITGATGMATPGAIVAGEHNPDKLAGRKDVRIRATKEQVAQSAEGDWREELLFVSQQSLELYDIYLGKITECDQRIETHLKIMQSKPGTIPPPMSEALLLRKPGWQFNLRCHLHRIAELTSPRLMVWM